MKGQLETCFWSTYIGSVFGIVGSTIFGAAVLGNIALIAMFLVVFGSAGIGAVIGWRVGKRASA
jgi:hypothetical protein